MTEKTLMAAVAAAAAGEDEEKPKVADPADAPEEDDDEKDEEEMTDKAVKAERARILGIQSMSFPGQDKLVAKLIDDGVSLGDAAVALNTDQKAKGQKFLQSLDADEQKVKNLRSEATTANDTIVAESAKPGATLSGEAKWAADFDASAELQAEYPTKSDYLSFKRAEARGQVRFLKNRNG